MNSIWTVMAFTMRNKLRSKAFIVTTIVLAVLLVVVGNLPYILSKFDSNGPAAVGYVEGQQPAVIAALQKYYSAQEEPEVALQAYQSESVLKQTLTDGNIDGYLTFVDDPVIHFPKTTYNSDSALGSGAFPSLLTGLQAAKNELVVQDLGITEAQRTMLAAPVELTPVQVSSGDDTGKTQEEQGTAIGLTYVLIILLFMAVMITGQLIATEITAEKSSRVMEILVTSVSPLKQMFGKIIGTFLIGLLQIVVLLGALLLNLLQPQNAGALETMGVQLQSIDPALVAFAVLFYLTGFFLYATLFAAVGSIVSRTEDLAQAVMPITLITVVAFYVSMFGLTHPNHILIVICSFIPFFTPFLMFLRIGLGDPAWWEVVLAIGILLASVLLIGWISAKIYRAGVLMYGKKPSMKELFKAMKAYKV
ncbi:potassium ABC transporter permease [Cohnella kolymensis]|uniref:Potassium ABC transporter permease n=1 Tax=Cohnella kolymensis TaxID=1590652 RepID=A0ABR5A997_9BACL|nr:ABC transporter permease [Cohnella kolymensis]KIL37492.1 potassium ABC transporter permease [Cohnella kolymensis]